MSEVASLGGFGRQYQVNVDPNRLRNYGLSIQRVVEAVRGGNAETGGRLIEFGGTEYMVRGRGYAKSVADFESIVVSASESGTPIRIRDIGHVTVGPDLRRGVADLDGAGEVVSGIVVMRQGENAVDVIDRVKERIRQIEPGLPPGMEIVPIYDRSALIRRAIDNVSETLVEVVLTVAFVVLLFLWHVPSALIPLITIPVAVLVAFIPFRALGITANIMSLGGIAIAIGELVDAAIVVVEQTHKKLEEAQRERIDPRPSRDRPRGGQRGGAGELLRAARDRGVVPPGADARVAGRAAVHTARLHQDAHDARGGGPRDHARPRAARALHARAALRVPAGVALPGGQRGGRRPDPVRGVASHQPFPHADLRAGRPLVAAVEVVGDRRRRGARRRHGAGVHAPRIGVHAAARRGVACLHADDDARHLDQRGAEAAAGERPGDQAVPRGRSRARQGGARRHEHRSRAAVDARDGDHAQADVRVAPCRHVVLRVGAGMDEARAPARHARSHLARSSWSRR